jgi:hypothetical protein
MAADLLITNFRIDKLWQNQRNLQKKKTRQKLIKILSRWLICRASQLEKWLKTEESKNTGWDSGDGESIDHKSGEKIIKMLGKKKTELTSSDYTHMHKVIAYISRHKAQKPAGDV